MVRKRIEGGGEGVWEWSEKDKWQEVGGGHAGELR